jgi:hypothetical protein
METALVLLNNLNQIPSGIVVLLQDCYDNTH